MIVAVDPGLTGAICFYDWRTTKNVAFLEH